MSSLPNRIETHLLNTPPSNDALRHSGCESLLRISPTVTLYLDVELSSDKRPGTEQNTSDGWTGRFVSIPFLLLSSSSSLYFTETNAVLVRISQNVIAYCWVWLKWCCRPKTNWCFCRCIFTKYKILGTLPDPLSDRRLLQVYAGLKYNDHATASWEFSFQDSQLGQIASQNEQENENEREKENLNNLLSRGILDGGSKDYNKKRRKLLCVLIDSPL